MGRATNPSAQFQKTAQDVRDYTVGSTAADMLNASVYSDYVAPTAQPAKAPAAPKGNTKEIFTGLAEALNSYQLKLKQQGKIEVPDEYEIVFTPGMQNSKVKRPGETDKRKVPIQANTTARDFNPATNSVNVNAKAWQVQAGTQIVQFIDLVMRNSTYITDQQIVDVDKDGKSTPNGKSTTGQTAWYKISVEATQLKYDNLRKDHAYRMKYVISPYAINTMQSNFFPNSRYRGSHKSYNYWFTGANTDILNFEQEFNNLYRLIISGIGQDLQTKARTDFRDQYRRTPLATSEQSSQGSDNYIGEPAANAADFLYSPTDQAKIKLRIVGDPGWMQQGEVATGINPRTFNFNPFNADGGINYDSQEIVFDVSWNRPSDYDFNTGLAEINANTTKNNQPQENATYTAIRCKSYFTRGKFEQELEGRLLIEFDAKNPQTQSTNGRADTANIQTQTNTVRTSTQTRGETQLRQYESNTLGLPESITSPTPGNTLLSPTVAREATTLPSSNPQPATSNGVIQNTGGEQAPTTFSQSVQQGQAAQRTRLNQAIAGQILNNQNIAKDQ